MTAEKKAEAKVEEAAPAAPEAPAAEEKKPEHKMEASYLDRGVKDGTVFLKRKGGKARLRKIVSKKGKAQLFLYDRGVWSQKSALTDKGDTHGLKWHLRHKWLKIEEKDLPKPPGPKKVKEQPKEPTEAPAA